jgi:hypothetical protein
MVPLAQQILVAPSLLPPLLLQTALFTAFLLLLHVPSAPKVTNQPPPPPPALLAQQSAAATLSLHALPAVLEHSAPQLALHAQHGAPPAHPPPPAQAALLDIISLKPVFALLVSPLTATA